MDKVKLTSIAGKIFIAYAAYLTLSLALILPILNIATSGLYRQFTGRQLEYQLVGFNPFTLAVFAYGLRDTNPDGSTLWAMDKLVINPSLLHSAWRGALAMDEIRLLGLTLLPEKIGPETFNFSDILGHIDNRSSAQKQGQTQSETKVKLPRVWIGEFELQARLLQFTDSHREKPFNAGLKDFHFKLQDFSTLSEQGDGYYLRAQSALGGALEWQGDISAAGSKTWGSFSLSKVKLLPMWQFMEPQLNFTLNDGTFSIQGQYQLNWEKDFNWQVTNIQAALENFDVQQTQKSTLVDHKPSAIQWKELAINIAKVSSVEKKATIKSLSLDGLLLSSWHQHSQLGLVDMFTLRAVNHAEVSISSNTQPTLNEASLEESNNWQASIDDTTLNNTNVHWLVPELDNRNVHIEAINLNIKNLSNSHSSAQVNAKFLIDKVAQLDVDGVFTPAFKSAAFNVNLTNLPLNWANPIISQQLNASLISGDLNTEIDIAVKNSELTRITAALRVSNFNAVDSHQASIASIQDVTVSAIEIEPQKRSLLIKNIDIEKLHSQIAIAADGSTNFNTLMKSSDPDVAAKNTELEQRVSSPYQWRIADIKIHDAAIKFTDETPLSTFSTQIESFTGHILNINSDVQQALAIDFKGQVDGYAPVTLKGEAKPFLTDPAMNLALNFKSIDLGLFNPYSTTFTGWKIEKGLLNVGLDYQLQDKRIVGKNRVILDQLTLGERIDSRRLVDIPLRLALALLTDEHGIADLQVPVAGTTDDPSFNIGAIVWTAVRNSIMKVITAPFNLLASLVDSEEDLGQVVFEPQQALLTELAMSSLADLKRALDQRPQLRLSVTGDVNLASESIPFQQQALNKKYLAQGLSQADIDQQNTAWRRTSISMLTNQEAIDISSMPNDKLIERLLSEQPLPTPELQQLAEKRAVAVKQYLLTNLAMDDERVFVQSSPLLCQQKDVCTQARASFSIQ